MKTPPTEGMLKEATLSLQQAANRLGIPIRELRALLGRGDLPFLEISGKLRVAVLSLEAYQNAQHDSAKNVEAGKTKTSTATPPASKPRASSKSGKPPQRKRHPP